MTTARTPPPAKVTAKITLGRHIRLPWTVDVYQRPRDDCSVIAKSVRKLPEPARGRAEALVYELLTRAHKQAQDGTKLQSLPHWRSLGDGLFEFPKGQLRVFSTRVPHHKVVLLLDVVEKKTDKLHPDVISRVRQLRREALANYPGPCDWFGVDRERETSAPTSQ